MSNISIEKAVKQLSLKFNQTNFKPSQFDLDCFKSLIDQINYLTSEAYHDNQLFAKMYVFYLTHELQHWGCIQKASKSMMQINELPLEHYVDVFHRKLNEHESEKRNSIDETFTKDQVITSLNNNINQIIRKYKNEP